MLSICNLFWTLDSLVIHCNVSVLVLIRCSGSLYTFLSSTSILTWLPATIEVSVLSAGDVPKGDRVYY